MYFPRCSVSSEWGVFVLPREWFGQTVRSHESNCTLRSVSSELGVFICCPKNGLGQFIQYLTFRFIELGGIFFIFPSAQPACAIAFRCDADYNFSLRRLYLSSSRPKAPKRHSIDTTLLMDLLFNQPKIT